ncbi:MAG: DNA-binding protein WhiA [Mycoplasmoidaceae bacterium]
MKKTFTKNVKEEILSLKFNKNFNDNILNAVLRNLLVINNKNEIMWSFSSYTVKLLEFIFMSLNKFGSFKKVYSNYDNPNNQKKQISKLIVSGDFNLIINNLNIFDNDIKIKNMYSKYAFITGLFLSSGSINSPLSKTYHLEFRLKDIYLTNILFEYLLDLGFEPKIIVAKKNIIYLKKSEQITDLLKLFGAKDSMLLFEDQRIKKDYENQIHRLNNLDVSNIKKTVESSTKIITCIKFIFKNKNIFNKLTSNEKEFCKIKIKHPDWSLKIISKYFNDKLNIKITRSGLNHYSRKIKNYCK